jgi:hypothetical protein
MFLDLLECGIRSCNRCKFQSLVVNENLFFRTLRMATDGFLKVPVNLLLDKWVSKSYNTNVGRVDLCTRLNAFKRRVNRNTGKPMGKRNRSNLYVCPYCFTYFLNKYMAFLHLRPRIWLVAF